VVELGYGFSGFSGFFKNPGRILKSLPGGFPFFFCYFLNKKIFFKKIFFANKIIYNIFPVFREWSKSLPECEAGFLPIILTLFIT
jgi:hypothetical protein